MTPDQMLGRFLKMSLECGWAVRLQDVDVHVDDATKTITIRAKEIPAFRPFVKDVAAGIVSISCPECGDSGYLRNPQNGMLAGIRCSHGCQVKCSVCYDPNCDNPGGQH